MFAQVREKIGRRLMSTDLEVTFQVWAFSPENSDFIKYQLNTEVSHFTSAP